MASRLADVIVNIFIKLWPVKVLLVVQSKASPLT